MVVSVGFLHLCPRKMGAIDTYLSIHETDSQLKICSNFKIKVNKKLLKILC